MLDFTHVVNGTRNKWQPAESDRDLVFNRSLVISAQASLGEKGSPPIVKAKALLLSNDQYYHQ
jgi:hypothetical protein